MRRTADLSVLMATYNHAPFLARALNAILHQSVLPKEVIVVDDASSDETPAILAEFARSDSIIRVFRNERNQGVNASSCRALANATANYVYFAGSDDRVLPGFVEKSMGLLSRHPEAGLCCSYHSTFDGATGEVRHVPSGWCDSPRFFSPVQVERVVGHGSIPGHTSILKRSTVEAARGFLPDLEWHADYFLTLVAAFREGMCYIPESLALLRVMPGTYSANVNGSERQRVVLNALFDRLKSPGYADVAPSFRRSGSLSVYGTNLIRAAATRSDLWSEEILGLLNCLTADQYESLLESVEPTVRALASLFLGPFAHEIKAELANLRQKRQDFEPAPASVFGRRHQLNRLKSTWLGKMLRTVVPYKRLLRAAFKLQRTGQLVSR